MRFVSLSPSALTFDWAECRACWWHLYVAGDEKKGFRPLPKIFNNIDGAMKACFEGQSASAMIPGTSGRIQGGQSLRSGYFAPDGCNTPIRFNGRTDFIVELDDGTLCVPDAKTAEVKEEHVGFYSTQLHAYAYCLEHPDPDKKRVPEKVSRLGLYIFQPGSFWVDPATGRAALGGESKWLEVPLDMAAFMMFMAEVGRVVDSPVEPVGKPDCQTCNQRLLQRAAAPVVQVA
jgi:hypothetical protein